MIRDNRAENNQIISENVSKRYLFFTDKIISDLGHTHEGAPYPPRDEAVNMICKKAKERKTKMRGAFVCVTCRNVEEGRDMKPKICARFTE